MAIRTEPSGGDARPGLEPASRLSRRDLLLLVPAALLTACLSPDPLQRPAEDEPPPEIIWIGHI